MRPSNPRREENNERKRNEEENERKYRSERSNVEKKKRERREALLSPLKVEKAILNES
jgi:hypothetical protein